MNNNCSLFTHATLTTRLLYHRLTKLLCVLNFLLHFVSIPFRFYSHSTRALHCYLMTASRGNCQSQGHNTKNCRTNRCWNAQLLPFFYVLLFIIILLNERHTSTSTSTELRASSEGVSESATWALVFYLCNTKSVQTRTLSFKTGAELASAWNHKR